MLWRHHSCIHMNTKIWMSSIIFELFETVWVEIAVTIYWMQYIVSKREWCGHEDEVETPWQHRGLHSCHWIMMKRTYEPLWACDYWDDLIVSSSFPVFSLLNTKMRPCRSSESPIVGKVSALNVCKWQPLNKKRNVYLQKSIECFSKENI